MSRRQFKSLWNRVAGRSGTFRRPPLRQHRLGFESLEDRRVLTTLIVDLTSPFAFHTIGAAVTAAHSGDTIDVASGTYDESVTIDKSLTIVGGRQNFNFVATGQTGPSTVDAGNAEFGFLLKANNVTIKNFTLTDASTALIETNPSFSGYHITNNKFSNDDAIGIRMGTLLTSAAITSTISGNMFTNLGRVSIADVGPGVRNVTISNNLFEDLHSDDSIQTQSTGQSINVQILDNTFSNLIGGGTPGMVLTNLTKSKIDGNTIFGTSNPLTDESAILLGGGVTNTVVSNNVLLYPADPADGITIDESVVATADTGNTITGNTVNGYLDGILVDGQSQNTITKNSITNSSPAGIYLLDGASKNTVSSNTITDCAIGILLDDVAGNTVSKNSISGSNAGASNGIYLLDGSATNTISGNTVNGMLGGGFVVDGSNDNTFTSNVANFNEHEGILLQNGSTGNTFTGNTADNNQGIAGIQDASGGSNSFSKNTANHNGTDGIDIDSGNTIKVLNNIATGNVAVGMSISGVSNSMIKGNTTNNNESTGLALSGDHSDTISGNISDNNFGSGVISGNITDNTFSGNTAKNNFKNGVFFDSLCTGNSITGNTVTGNAQAIVGFDLVDVSVGSGTDGTANTWHKNTADTANPDGLLTA